MLTVHRLLHIQRNVWGSSRKPPKCRSSRGGTDVEDKPWIYQRGVPEKYLRRLWRVSEEVNECWSRGGGGLCYIHRNGSRSVCDWLRPAAPTSLTARFTLESCEDTQMVCVCMCIFDVVGTSVYTVKHRTTHQNEWINQSIIQCLNSTFKNMSKCSLKCCTAIEETKHEI